MNHIEKSKILEYLSERMDKVDDFKIKAEILHIKTMIMTNQFDIRVWED